jgi:hypothetical protein
MENKNDRTTKTQFVPPDEPKDKPIGSVGWICPVCGRGNSPFNMTCPCRNTTIMPHTTPNVPWQNPVTYSVLDVQRTTTGKIEFPNLVPYREDE